MKTIMFFVVATVCAPLAAFAASAAKPTAMSGNTVVISAHNADGLSYEVAHLNGQVLTLTREYSVLQQQSADGANEVPGLTGVIPSGG